MPKFNVSISVTLESYSSIEVEATDQADANRIVSESIAKDGFSSEYWFDADEWDTDWDNATDLKVV